MLGTLPEKPKSTWREQVPTLVHACNCKGIMGLILVHIISCLLENHAYQLTFLFGTNTAGLKGNTSTKYVENLKQRI